VAGRGLDTGVAGLIARLDLSDTRLTDAGLDHIAKLPLLHDLDLDRTRITDERIMKLARLKKIVRLGVTSRSVTKAGVAKFRQASGNKHEVRH